MTPEEYAKLPDAIQVYTFHRAEGWYPIEEKADHLICEHVIRNPGTLKVVNELTGKVVYDINRDVPFNGNEDMP